MIKFILKDIEDFCFSKLTNVDFSILFGSSALSHKDVTSDIDFKIFLNQTPTEQEREITAVFAQDLNKKYGRSADLKKDDVPYKVKTLISRNLLDKAVTLCAFQDVKNQLYIPELRLTEQFLKSDMCQMRTILSALTTPNLFITGDIISYKYYTRQAFVNVKKLACKVYGLSPDDLESIIQCLIYSPQNNTYKKYLGYRDCPNVKTFLAEKFKEYE